MMQSSAVEITTLIRMASEGDQQAESLLCEAVYEELHAAAARLVHERDSSVEPTMLVHDVFMGIFRRRRIRHICNRRYFYAVAIDHMRKLLIDHHRCRGTQKAGGDRVRTPLDELLDGFLDDFRKRNHCEFEELEAALEWLKSVNERQFQVVTHRYLTGLTIKQTAELLETSTSQIERDWRIARAKLYRYLQTCL